MSESPTLSTKLYTIFNENNDIITSASICLSACLFFLVIGFPRLFLSFPAFSQRYVGLVLLGIICVLTALSAWQKNISIGEKVALWLQSNILTFFSFAYFLRVNSIPFELLGYSLNTKLVFIPLAVLMYFVNLELFGKNRLKLHLLIPQILLFSLMTYAFISLLGVDRTALRIFTTDWLSNIFSLSNEFWLVLCALGVGVVTALSFKFKESAQNVWAASVIFVLSWQILFILNQFNFTYWYKSLLFLVIWDFVYSPMSTVFREVKDSKYFPKLTISAIYHFLVFVALMYFANFNV